MIMSSWTTRGTAVVITVVCFVGAVCFVTGELHVSMVANDGIDNALSSGDDNDGVDPTFANAAPVLIPESDNEAIVSNSSSEGSITSADETLAGVSNDSFTMAGGDEEFLDVTTTIAVSSPTSTSIFTDEDSHQTNKTSFSSSEKGAIGDLGTTRTVNNINATSANSGIVTSLGLDKDAAVSPLPPVMVTPGETHVSSGETTNDTTTPWTHVSATTLPTVTDQELQVTTTYDKSEETSSALTSPSTSKPTTETTTFWSFLDPNFEKKYVPRNKPKNNELHSSTGTIGKNQGDTKQQPLQCYVCANSSTNCEWHQAGPSRAAVKTDVSNLLIRRRELSSPSASSGVVLVNCPETSQTCGKLLVTVRYLDNSETRYETTITRFCSSVSREYCDSKAGSSSTYQQCYCRSQACNAAIHFSNGYTTAKQLILAESVMLMTAAFTRMVTIR